MLSFNLKGLLIPPAIIPSTVEEFEYEFAIKTGDSKRIELFDKYKSYCSDLKILTGKASLQQWIDGSYVTLNRNPSDIDLVTFVDFEIAKLHQAELKKFLYPESVGKYGVDGYIIVTYSEGSERQQATTKADVAFWLDHFGRTKPNRQRKRAPKGFLEIIV